MKTSASDRKNITELVLKGLSNRQIANQIGIKEARVKLYLTEIYIENQVSSRTQLIAKLNPHISSEEYKKTIEKLIKEIEMLKKNSISLPEGRSL